MAQSLFERIAAGDAGAVRECIDRYGGPVWSLTRRCSASDRAAEDAAREIFAALWRSAGRLEPAADPGALDRAAAALERALAGASAAPMPAPLAERLHKSADDWLADRAEQEAREGPSSFRPAAWPGWVAAAALLLVAAAGWWPRVTARTTGGGIASSEQDYIRYQSIPGIVRAPWSDFEGPADRTPPEIVGVRGGVLWNEEEQGGYLTLAGLPINDPRREQYQLWITDSRGPGQRVSGGVFNAVPSGGEVIVPINPSLPIKGAAAFAVTIEPPGGSAVSDLSRRVCTAGVPSR